MDRVTYGKTTGAWSYETDGTGSTAANQIAQLMAGSYLTATDVFTI
jgi:hypothetical protein